ncbi:MAG: 50S ribosome-binding GTPase, partial [Oscillospiraceae bacterium]|nr:50S ribosome-binding GTPase [Oscillospiraceae bacterium]
YPDEDIEELDEKTLLQTLENVKAQLSGLLSRFDSGSAVTKGVETAIIGKPNVGKSALMNLLSGFGRSIVTDVAGTTRDVVEQTVSLGDLLLHLADTAGIHSTDDVVESIGIERAKEKTDRAGLIFAVFDSSRPLDEADERIMALCEGKRAVAVLNKSDLPPKADIEKIKASFAYTVSLCALDGSGLSELEKACALLLCTNELDTSQAMLSTERQRKNALDALAATEEAINGLTAGITLDAVNVSIDAAISSLMELTGQKTTDAVVDEVFSQFCVGK